jgi:histidyl-tRNA synthetase
MTRFVTRLVPRLLEAGILKVGPATPAPVLVTSLEEKRTPDYLRIGTLLREAGIATEVYLETARLGEQLRYAHRKGVRLALIAGEVEFAHAVVKVKDLRTGDEIPLPMQDLAQKVQEILRAAA